MTKPPTRSEWRRAIAYVRTQLRLMFPGRKPHRHPEYRRLVTHYAAMAAATRHGRAK